MLYQERDLSLEIQNILNKISNDNVSLVYKGMMLGTKNVKDEISQHSN